MNIDIHIIIDMKDNFGVGDHFQVLGVSEGTYRAGRQQIACGFDTVLIFYVLLNNIGRI